MSSILKVFLLLAVMICISKAQLHESGQQCLCRRVRRGINPRSGVKDIQIYSATIFCEKVEIIVTDNQGLRYCLNPEVQLKNVQKLLTKIMAKRNKATTVSTASTTSNVNTASL
ncbi:C-X-C motif chemokine 6-like [Cheilinus undulatus]|uniref:C-X-C motif chemokine 6-like n=1 Tax=Cheilinus undulatus TaxID=241271 RepID=UPI001BD38118|nr:C-X-C motif chemokine 6-like [Cheilinus undulatus]